MTRGRSCFAKPPILRAIGQEISAIDTSFTIHARFQQEVSSPVHEIGRIRMSLTSNRAVLQGTWLEIPHADFPTISITGRYTTIFFLIFPELSYSFLVNSAFLAAKNPNFKCTQIQPAKGLRFRHVPGGIMG